MATAVSKLAGSTWSTTTQVGNSKGSVANATEDDWDRAFAVNAKGTFLLSRAAVPHLIAAGGGSIITRVRLPRLSEFPTSPRTALPRAPCRPHRSMAVDLAQHQIRVNAICPGTVFHR